MDQRNIGTNFYISLLDFLLSAKRHLVMIGAEYDLTNIQAITLILLDDKTDCPMKRLSQMFYCDASNVTGIVDGLESKGLVERRSDPDDRRIKTIAILPAGKRLQQQILDRLAEDNGYMFDSLTDDEAKQFVCIVQKIAAQQKPAC
jgi:DNA-binding MarR family transcriptional regulator